MTAATRTRGEDMFPSRVASYNDNDLIGTNATTARSQLRHQAPAVPAHRRALEAAGEAPDAGRRRAGHPVRRHRPRRLRLQPDLPEQAGRVRRGGEQRGHREDGDLPDVLGPDHVHQAVADATARQPTLRSDGDGQITVHGAGQVRHGLPRRPGAAAGPRVADPDGRDTAAGHGGGGAHPDHRRRAAERPPAGHRPLAAGGHRRLANPGDRRQRAVPGLPRRAQHAEGLAARVPRGGP